MHPTALSTAGSVFARPQMNWNSGQPSGRLGARNTQSTQVVTITSPASGQLPQKATCRVAPARLPGAAGVMLLPDERGSDQRQADGARPGNDAVH